MITVSIRIETPSGHGINIADECQNPARLLRLAKRTARRARFYLDQIRNSGNAGMQPGSDYDGIRTE